MADDDRQMHRLQTVELDEESLAAASRDQEQERQIAIFDPSGGKPLHPEGAERGPYDLKMGLVENRLVLDVRGPAYERRHILVALAVPRPDQRLLHDLRELLPGHPQFDPAQIEALDMGRRACTTRRPSCCRPGSPARSTPTWTPRGGFSR